ncbi:MAG: hypothetical protein WCY27_02290 [archaeon]|jgi:deoxyribodipyrimidine photolyase|nr:hypothetical protein [archaeon]
MKNLVFGLFDVLVNNKINTVIDNSYLKELKTFCEIKKVNLYLVTGQKEEYVTSILEESNLFDIFKKENIIYVDSKYLSTLGELDIQLRKEKADKDANYYDQYLKIYFLKSNPILNSENTVYVGHDIWYDAYYVSKYTQSNVILLTSTLSYYQKPHSSKLKTLPTINLNLEEFKDLILNKRVFDYSALHSFAQNTLFSKMIGDLDLSKVDFSKIIKK